NVFRQVVQFPAKRRLRPSLLAATDLLPFFGKHGDLVLRLAGEAFSAKSARCGKFRDSTVTIRDLKSTLMFRRVRCWDLTPILPRFGSVRYVPALGFLDFPMRNGSFHTAGWGVHHTSLRIASAD